MSTKIMSGFVQLALTGVAVLIVFKTIQDAGIVLYTFHPSLMAIGVSSFAINFASSIVLIMRNNFNAYKMRNVLY